MQSADGRVAHLQAIAEAANRHGVVTLVDATQAAGRLPIDASRFDFVTAGAYKWLLSPRGAAFLTVSKEHLTRLTPFHAGWCAGRSDGRASTGARCVWRRTRGVSTARWHGCAG